jgi:DNA mismatch endonuclease, patch repair protein
MDFLTPEKRSDLMRRIRGRDTGPEKMLRKIAFSMGYRYRLNRKDLPGTPDLVFPGKHKAIFVHGCFWHYHKKCGKNVIPATRQEYWIPKLEANRLRDRRKSAQLKRMGWTTLTVWECQLKNVNDLQNILREFLGASR